MKALPHPVSLRASRPQVWSKPMAWGRGNMCASEVESVAHVLGLDRLGEDGAVAEAGATALDAGVVSGRERARDLRQGEEVAPAAPLGAAVDHDAEAAHQRHGVGADRCDRALELPAVARRPVVVVIAAPPAAVTPAAPSAPAVVVVVILVVIAAAAPPAPVVVVVIGTVVVAAVSPAAAPLALLGHDGERAGRRKLVVERGLGGAGALRAAGGGEGKD